MAHRRTKLLTLLYSTLYKDQMTSGAFWITSDMTVWLSTLFTIISSVATQNPMCRRILGLYSWTVATDLFQWGRDCYLISSSEAGPTRRPAWLAGGAGVILSVMDGPNRLPFPHCTGCPERSSPAACTYAVILQMYTAIRHELRHTRKSWLVL